MGLHLRSESKKLQLEVKFPSKSSWARWAYFFRVGIIYFMNRESYNAIESHWDASRHSFFGRERDYLDTLLKALPCPSEVLDLGCGTGRPMAE